MENRAERSALTHLKWFALRLVIIGAGAFTTCQGYEGERYFKAALERGAEDHCREVIASIPQLPDIIVTEETWQSCREVFLKGAERNPQDQVVNYLTMGGGSLAVVYGLAKLLSGLPLFTRGRGRFNLS